MTFPNKEIEALWAPWRVEYFKANSSRGDFLSEAARTSDDAAHLVVARRKTSFLIMNRFPYAVGHMMAVPYRKVADLTELTDDEKSELFDLAAHAQRILRKAICAEGFNIGINIGKCAGAGIVDHLHVHIVPRWEGDNNFMPVIADTRVLPQALDDLYRKLIAAGEKDD
jgi:ATP adenylyltransferase